MLFGKACGASFCPQMLAAFLCYSRLEWPRFPAGCTVRPTCSSHSQGHIEIWRCVYTAAQLQAVRLLLSECSFLGHRSLRLGLSLWDHWSSHFTHILFSHPSSSQKGLCLPTSYATGYHWPAQPQLRKPAALLVQIPLLWSRDTPGSNCVTPLALPQQASDVQALLSGSVAQLLR